MKIFSIIGIVMLSSSCQPNNKLNTDVCVISGHTYILVSKGESVSIIHDESCASPDSTHVNYVRIIPRFP